MPGKLVRDKIPDIIRQCGGQAQVTRMHPSQMRMVLKKKLVEEAQEVADGGPDNVLADLADVLEVMVSMVHEYGYQFEDLTRVAETKRNMTGGFENRTWLEETE